MSLSVYKCHCQYTNVIVSIQKSLSVYKYEMQAPHLVLWDLYIFLASNHSFLKADTATSSLSSPPLNTYVLVTSKCLKAKLASEISMEI